MSTGTSRFEIWLERSSLKDKVRWEKSVFYHEGLGIHSIAYRGTNPVVLDDGSLSGSFKTTKAVKALLLLLLEFRLEADIFTPAEFSLASIQGYKGSFAVALDYAVEARPLWIREMFGEAEERLDVVRRFFHITNPRRKWGNFLIVQINRRIILPTSIHVYVGGTKVEDRSVLDEIIAMLKCEDTQGQNVAVVPQVKHLTSDVPLKSLLN